MGLPKGRTNNPAGRKPGSKNKLRKPLVEEIFDIAQQLNEEGKGLADCAKQNPEWFHTNFLKNLIPKNVEVTGKGGGPISVLVGPIAEKLDEIYSGK